MLLIIGILLAIAIPTFLSVTKQANDTAAQANLQTALTGAKTFYTQQNQTYSNIENPATSNIHSIDVGLSFVTRPRPVHWTQHRLDRQRERQRAQHGHVGEGHAQLLGRDRFTAASTVAVDGQAVGFTGTIYTEDPNVASANLRGDSVQRNSQGRQEQHHRLQQRRLIKTLSARFSG